MESADWDWIQPSKYWRRRPKHRLQCKFVSRWMVRIRKFLTHNLNQTKIQERMKPAWQRKELQCLLLKWLRIWSLFWSLLPNTCRISFPQNALHSTVWQFWSKIKPAKPNLRLLNNPLKTFYQYFRLRKCTNIQPIRWLVSCILWPKSRANLWKKL